MQKIAAHTAPRSEPFTCILIAGPTGVGKTDMAIQLARHFDTSIISADSRQCFKELSIGVAKPHLDQLQSAMHYFINSHSVQQEVNAALFEQYALSAVQEIFRDKKIAIIVGGTGLYIKAFCEGMDEIPAIPDTIRKNMRAEYEKKGITWLQNEIKKNDPDYYQDGEIQNPQRLLRALEVKMHTGISIRSFQEGKKTSRPFNVIKIGLELPRAELYDRINRRVDQMMQEGLLEEVKSLLPSRNYNALQTVGYKELFQYLDGAISLEKAIDEIKKNTRHYAKRQLTWFKKDTGFNWFSPQDDDSLLSFLSTKLRLDKPD
jgi:tRNA dimethylallyltransferase